MKKGYTPTTAEMFSALNEAGIGLAPAYRWLGEIMAQAKADGWDEGYSAGLADGGPDSGEVPNPYRKEAT